MTPKNRRFVTMAQWSLVVVTLLIMINFEVGWLYYVLGGVALLIITVSMYSVSNEELTIEVLCDVDKYLQDIKRNRVKKDVSLYSLQRTFGLIHKLDYSEAKEEFSTCDFDSIKNQKKYYPLYIMIRTRLLFEEKDIAGLVALQSEVEGSNNSNEALLLYLKTYRSILKGSKLDAIEQIKLAIPKQPHRIEVFELEYQLSKLYLETKKYVDSAFVAEFISKKKYKVIYVSLCKDLAIAANEQIIEE